MSQDVSWCLRASQGVSNETRENIGELLCDEQARRLVRHACGRESTPNAAVRQTPSQAMAFGSCYVQLADNLIISLMWKTFFRCLAMANGTLADGASMPLLQYGLSIICRCDSRCDSMRATMTCRTMHSHMTVTILVQFARFLKFEVGLPLQMT